MVRTRFAPSPTGFVHIGSLRTALFAFLFARKNQGVNVLRIEDTDRQRLVEGALENLLSVMKTMGIEFDEGFYIGDDGKISERGKFGPYLQSQRLELYKKSAEELVGKKSAYYCFCSEQRLDELRKEQTALKKPPMYDRLCRNLSDEEIKKQMQEFSAQGKSPVIRFAVPAEGQTIVNDLIYGEITYENKVLDDQVIIKSDGFPTYHLAVVVDDHYMQISHVICGDEWLPSTPKHLLIYKAFGWEPTRFAHIPLIVNPDKSKLSKRQGDVAVEDFLKKGYLKEALINFVAFLGWNPKTEEEFFTLQELISEFDLSKINKSSAVFDVSKLDWLNSSYIRQKSQNELAEMLKPYWKEQGIAVENFPDSYLAAIAGLEKERLKKLSEIGERTGYFFKAPEYDPALLVWKKSDSEKTIQALKDTAAVLENLDEKELTKPVVEESLKKMIASKGYDNGSVFWPLRVALTGLAASPGPLEVLETLALGLGKKEILSRIEIAKKKFSA